MKEIKDKTHKREEGRIETTDLMLFVDGGG
jgi:hypothetical protein